MSEITKGRFETSAEAWDWRFKVITDYECNLNTGLLTVIHRIEGRGMLPGPYMEEKQLKVGKAISATALEMHRNAVQGRLLNIPYGDDANDALSGSQILADYNRGLIDDSNS